MSKRLLTTLALVAVLAPAAGAQRPRSVRVALQPESTLHLVVQPESKLWVEGTSTVRAFKCEAKKIEGLLRLTPTAVSPAVAELQDAVAGLEVEVPVGDLECGNDTMVDHMRKALKAQEAPVIQFRLTSHEVAPQESGEAKITMTGALTIAGTERTVTVNAVAAPGPNGTLRITGSKEIAMTEFGVKPPKLMLGALKVHETVTVHFDVVLKQ